MFPCTFTCFLIGLLKLGSHSLPSHLWQADRFASRSSLLVANSLNYELNYECTKCLKVTQNFDEDGIISEC